MADINVTVSSAGVNFLLDGAGANAAATYAAQAAASAASAAAVTNTFISTSTTSLLIGAGSKTWTVGTGKQFQAGQFLLASSSADATQWMWGTVTSYNSATGALVVNVTLTGGAGTYASWNVSVSGVQGSGTAASTLNGKADSAFAQVALANIFTLAQTINAGVVTVSTPILNLTQTWNAAGVVFTGVKANVTNTASAAGSLLLDLQVGGTSMFSVDKTGGVLAAGALTVSGAFAASAAASVAGVLTAIGGVRLGAADAAAPVAQTIQAQSVLAGTSNTAGANTTLKLSAGTGAGAGGSWIVQVAPAGSTGTAQNPWSTAFTIDSTKLATFAGNVLVSTSGTPALAIAATAGNAAVLNLQGNANTSAGSFEVHQDGSSNALLWQRANAPMLFGVNGTEIMRLGSSAVAINTTTLGGWPGNARLEVRQAANGDNCISGYASNATGSALLARVDVTTCNLMGIYYQGGQVGTITTNGSATAFNTTSDERLKLFKGAYAAGPATAIIRADPVRTFTWNELSAFPGQDAIGWGAQTSYATSADLASPGTDELDENGKPIHLWGLDQGKRTPYLWAAIGAEGGILDRLEALEAKLAA